MPTVTINGPMKAVTRTLFGGTQWGHGAVAVRNSCIRRERKILRAAFDRVRHDPNEKATAAMLARVLGGKLPTTETVLDTAVTILTEKPR